MTETTANTLAGLIVFVLLAAAGVAALYGLGAFTAWSFYPGSWGSLGRFLIAFLSFSWICAAGVGVTAAMSKSDQ